jgi:hypothetical protein
MSRDKQLRKPNGLVDETIAKAGNEFHSPKSNKEPSRYAVPFERPRPARDKNGKILIELAPQQVEHLRERATKSLEFPHQHEPCTDVKRKEAQC